MNSSMIRESFPVGPLGCNCSIIGDQKTGHCVVVDPGGNPELIIEKVKSMRMTVVEIIHTHAHLDHFLASGILRTAWDVRLWLHKNDLFLWRAVELQCRMLQIPKVSMPDPSDWLYDDMALSVCNGICLHTPGHTPGSVSFWFEQDNLLISGDTLFQESIGRTDLPGGDHRAIQNSIRERLFSLPEAALVVPGHGPETCIGHEKQFNPFVQGLF